MIGRSSARATEPSGISIRLAVVSSRLYDYKQQLALIDKVVAEIAALQLSTDSVTEDAVRQLHIDGAGSDPDSDALALIGSPLALTTIAGLL